MDSVNFPEPKSVQYPQARTCINNLMVSETNQQSAESMIREWKLANETTRVLQESEYCYVSTAMHAQSNMVPQSVPVTAWLIITLTETEAAACKDVLPL
jgi:hypothetical protein